MFVQVIQGRVRDAEGVQRQWRDWLERLAPDAVGWVGSTGGITPDDRFIAAVRFSSAEAASENSDRPEQGEWWSATERTLEDATFRESSDYSITGEPSDDAGFVQIMHGRVTDRQRMEDLDERMADVMRNLRPDVLGGYQIWLGDDEFIAVNYFTSEAEARAGESKDVPEDLAEGFREWQALVRDVRWFDLPDPWLHTAP